MTFPTVIDPKEMDLIDRIAKRVNPNAFVTYRPSFGLGGDEDISPRVKAWDDGLRKIARFDAAEIIEIVREHDAARKAEKEGE